MFKKLKFESVTITVESSLMLIATDILGRFAQDTALLSQEYGGTSSTSFSSQIISPKGSLFCIPLSTRDKSKINECLKNSVIYLR